MKKSDEKKLDDIWKVKVKEDASFCCEITGQSGDTCQLHSHHYYGRKNRSTRWYLPNGWCLSASIHKLSTRSAHQSPEWFRGKALDVRGKAWLNDLTKQFNKTFKGSYQDVLDYLEGRTKNYVL